MLVVDTPMTFHRVENDAGSKVQFHYHGLPILKIEVILFVVWICARSVVRLEHHVQLIAIACTVTQCLPR